MADIAAGYSWNDVTTMGGDELRSLEAHELAQLLAGALEAGSEAAAERATYYLDTKRVGEVAAIAMSQARERGRVARFEAGQG